MISFYRFLSILIFLIIFISISYTIKPIIISINNPFRGYVAFMLLCEPDTNCVPSSTKNAIKKCFDSNGSKIALQLYKQCTLNERVLCSTRSVIRRVVKCLKSNSSPNTLISQDTWACTMANVSLATLQCYRAYARARRKRKWSLFWPLEFGSTIKMSTTSRDNTPSNSSDSTSPSTLTTTSSPTTSITSTSWTIITSPALPPTHSESTTSTSEPESTISTTSTTTLNWNTSKAFLNFYASKKLAISTQLKTDQESTTVSAFEVTTLKSASTTLANSNIIKSLNEFKNSSSMYFLEDEFIKKSYKLESFLLLFREAADELELTLNDED